MKIYLRKEEKTNFKMKIIEILFITLLNYQNIIKVLKFTSHCSFLYFIIDNYSRIKINMSRYICMIKLLKI